MDTISALLLTAVIVAVLVIAAARNPLTKCPRCSGKGVIRSVVLPWRYRTCPRCGRSGEIRSRFGQR